MNDQQPDDFCSEDATKAILRGETAPWVQWCNDRGLDPRELVRLMLAGGTTTTTELDGMRVTTIDYMPDDRVLLVNDDGDVVGGIVDVDVTTTTT